MSHKTSAKCPKDPPKRIQSVCPVCLKIMSFQPAEFRKRTVDGAVLTCSRVCGQKLRRMRMISEACREYCNETFPEKGELLRYSLEDYNRETVESKVIA